MCLNSWLEKIQDISTFFYFYVTKFAKSDKFYRPKNQLIGPLFKP